MADTTLRLRYPTGATLYTQVENEAGQVWDGSDYAPFATASWASYATATPEDPAGSGRYAAQFPISSPAGSYSWTMFQRLGASPAAGDTEVGTGSDYWYGTTFGADIPSNPSPIDLITSTYANQVLTAGGVTLTGPQAAILPNLITSASREIARYCNRLFPLTTYTEILTPEGGRQDRGEPASAKLSAFPVQSVTSVMCGRSGVLTIKNTDTATNQFAQVAFAVTGDVEYLDLAYTGLTLSRTASGVTAADTVTFAANVTLAALATAINAIGGGWSATVQASYGLYPSASLVGVREPKNALSNGARLDLFTQPASSYDVDRQAGILRCYGNGWGSGLGGFGGGYGDVWGDSLDGVGGYGGTLGWGQYQCTYTAGWSSIPEQLQLVCAEAVKIMFARLDGDPSLKSESADKYTWAAKDSLANLSEDSMRTLMYYKSWSV